MATYSPTISPAVRAFLSEVRFAVLGTVGRDGTLQQTVMWYELRDDHVIMNTARGRVKDRNLRRDPRLSVCIEDGYRYVTIQGVAEIVDDPEVAQADIASLAIRYHGPEKGGRMIDTFRRQERVTLRMSIERVIANGLD